MLEHTDSAGAPKLVEARDFEITARSVRLLGQGATLGR
jgi:hypothetical protein